MEISVRVRTDLAHDAVQAAVHAATGPLLELLDPEVFRTAGDPVDVHLIDRTAARAHYREFARMYPACPATVHTHDRQLSATINLAPVLHRLSEPEIRHLLANPTGPDVRGLWQHDELLYAVPALEAILAYVSIDTPDEHGYATAHIDPAHVAAWWETHHQRPGALTA
ncbi:hypothetical protein GKE82_23555 [Conexibacter sp. W3-3-2]|uniref:hypothetical protein n=1 Tax=Conexibacter sp. W3-3-2 TaxID=2675227 RepID=UPI0012B8AE9D|nr:hypothetical protein [Conexibacter sp. W3-3-2]MTD47182.1 hypothetical protein [Conexibacter sp. W3-3-2]